MSVTTQQLVDAGELQRLGTFAISTAESIEATIKTHRFKGELNGYDELVAIARPFSNFKREQQASCISR